MENLSVSDILALLLIAASVFQCGILLGVRLEERWQRRKDSDRRRLKQYQRDVDWVISLIPEPVAEDPEQSQHVN